MLDECHHLPSDFLRVIAEYSLAPYRLGLTATPERSDGRHLDLETLIGPEVYRASPQELSGTVLSSHKIVQLKVRLSQTERARYDQLIDTRNAFFASAWHPPRHPQRLAIVCHRERTLQSRPQRHAGTS